MQFINHSGQNLKRLRKSIGLTQDQFALYFHTKRPSIGAYEEGRAGVPVWLVFDISRFAGCNMDDFFTKELQFESQVKVIT